MTLFDRVKADLLAARKARDPKVAVLSTLVGGVQKIEKATPGHAATDADVLAQVRSLLKGIEETIAALPAGDRQATYLAERDAISVYLPAQMSESEILDFVRNALDGSDLSSMKGGAIKGAAMSRLKAERAGRYDGQTAARVIDRVIADAA